MADETLLSVPNDEEAVDEEADTFFFQSLGLHPPVSSNMASWDLAGTMFVRGW